MTSNSIEKNGCGILKNEWLESRNDKFVFSAEEKISLFLGAYGSGKSEVAVNFAMLLSSRLKRHTPGDLQQIILADLDMINPYFRSVDAKEILNHHDIKVISPQFANTNVEVPALPGEIFSVFDQPSIRAVLDIGGEDLGARVVSSLKTRIQSVSYATYMVVNMNRPFTDTKEKIIIMMRELEEATGLPTSGMINNTNLLAFSGVGELLAANRILTEAGKETGVPLSFASGMDEDYPAGWGNRTPDGVDFLRLTRTISYDEPVFL